MILEKPIVNLNNLNRCPDNTRSKRIIFECKVEGKTKPRLKVRVKIGVSIYDHTQRERNSLDILFVIMFHHMFIVYCGCFNIYFPNGMRF